MLALPGKELSKGLPVVGIAPNKMEEKQFPWKEKSGNKNSKEHRSLSLFPVCFIGLDILGGLVCCFFSEKETPKPHAHPVELSKVGLLDLVK